MSKRPTKVKLPKCLLKYSIYKNGEHCTMGFLLNKAGVSNSKLSKLIKHKEVDIDNKKYTYACDLAKDLYGISEKEYTEITLQNDMSSENDRMNVLKNLLTELGIEYEE